MLERVISDESGRTLVLTLIILGIGVLLIPVFLSHVSTNLFATRVTEERLKEQYAADSGVEYALLQIQNGITTTSPIPTPYVINNKYVEVTWGEYITETYKITSTATSQVDESSTTIESYITLGMYDHLWLLDNAITSKDDVMLGPNTEVSGTVVYSGTLGQWPGSTITPPPGLPEPIPEDDWPTAGDLSDFFWDDVEDEEPYGPGDVAIDLNGISTLGPLLYIGDETSGYNLTIDNTGGEITVTLGGTIYVIGDLDFAQAGGSNAYTIDLNGQTIYIAEVENDDDHDTGDISFASKCTITGSGCIIAEGFVNFQPKMSSSPDDFVFVMSVTKYVWMKPQGNFYGSVAGDTYVDLQPGGRLIWTDWRGKDLNFPDGTTGRVRIRTYNINP